MALSRGHSFDFQRDIDIQNAEIRLNNSRELRLQAQKELQSDVRNVYKTYSTNLFFSKTSS